FMLLLFAVNFLVLGKGLFYQVTFLSQVLFYLLALAAHFDSSLREHALIRLVYFFCQVNVAMADAALKYARGMRMTVWKPSQR
ncbi:MAG TPA: glycosyltransferase family 2 protein, partial [Pseudomonadales bacterium]|nr:glycosyltransferase family 2 protein [Pseudomonadales bacterium]